MARLTMAVGMPIVSHAHSKPWWWACLRAVEVARELRASAAIASARASEAGELGGGSSFEGSESPPGE